ncbi:MAG TPA: thiamine pyrophosphate-binding protein, partial [Planctomycetota bacterium]|nr:thiamine pyrophosphate-binding protein [Planctomycetota bacterium]
MADAWGRLTETPGVALVTAGPGMLNAISALYGARMADSPVVLMAGASPRSQRGKGAFQEVDQVAVARPVVKAAWSLEDPARAGEDLARALAVATSGRPGPVYLSLPGDVLETDAGDPGAPSPLPAALPALAERDALAIIALLAEAKRPLILTGPAMGRGPRWAAVQRLAAAVGAPALPIESPRGVNDPWLRGATRLLAEADVVVLLGKPLDYSLRFGQAFARGARVIALDVEASTSAAGITLAVAADLVPAIERLAAVAATRAWPAPTWRDEVERARRAMPP